MTLGLHEKLKEVLKERLAKVVSAITIRNHMFIERSSGFRDLLSAEQALPKSGQIHDRLAEYVGEDPLLNFVFDTLGHELSELDDYRSDVASIKLTDITGYSDPSTVAARLVREFESLPRYYTLTFQLPEALDSLLDPSQNEYQLGPQLKLARITADFAQRYPLGAETKAKTQSVLASLLQLKEDTWNSERLYAQVNVTGYIGPYGGSQPAIVAEQTVRAICGLGIALRLLRFESKYSPLETEFPLNVFVHRLSTKNGWQMDTQYRAYDRTARALRGVSLDTIDGALDNDAKKHAWKVLKLKEMQSVFSAGEKAESTILASQWLLDSHAGRDDLLRFVQAMVALEILLGDKATSDEIGLGQLLRNRCAYLIGASHGQRAELLQDFGEIYRVRSEIVHRGKHRLKTDEWALFAKLHWMCNRVIQREVELLIADTK